MGLYLCLYLYEDRSAGTLQVENLRAGINLRFGRYSKQKLLGLITALAFVQNSLYSLCRNQVLQVAQLSIQFAGERPYLRNVFLK